MCAVFSACARVDVNPACCCLLQCFADQVSCNGLISFRIPVLQLVSHVKKAAFVLFRDSCLESPIQYSETNWVKMWHFRFARWLQSAASARTKQYLFVLIRWISCFDAVFSHAIVSISQKQFILLRKWYYFSAILRYINRRFHHACGERSYLTSFVLNIC